MAEIAMSKIMKSDECEAIRSQAEIEINPDSRAIEPPADSDIKPCVRRHGRPPAVISRRAPDDPRRRPGRVRDPNPAASVMQLPSAIMERSPAPRVLRLPIPSTIRIQPMAAVAVRPPSVIDQNDARLPAPL